MSTALPIKGVRLLPLIVAIIAFAAVFQIAHKQRLATMPLQESATYFHRISLLPRAYAQGSDGEFWPALDPKTRAFALPLETMTRGYTIGREFKDGPLGKIDAMLIGTINNKAAYTLTPVDSIASEYIYFGYAIANETEYNTLREAIRNGAALDSDIPVAQGSGTLGSSKLYRLRNKLEEVLAKDGVIPAPDRNALASVPALIEKPRDGHAWVLFLNYGTVRLPYPGSFPMLPSIVEGDAHVSK